MPNPFDALPDAPIDATKKVNPFDALPDAPIDATKKVNPFDALPDEPNPLDIAVEKIRTDHSYTPTLAEFIRYRDLEAARPSEPGKAFLAGMEGMLVAGKDLAVGVANDRIDALTGKRPIYVTGSDVQTFLEGGARGTDDLIDMVKKGWRKLPGRDGIVGEEPFMAAKAEELNRQLFPGGRTAVTEWITSSNAHPELISKWKGEYKDYVDSAQYSIFLDDLDRTRRREDTAAGKNNILPEIPLIGGKVNNAIAEPLSTFLDVTTLPSFGAGAIAQGAVKGVVKGAVKGAAKGAVKGAAKGAAKEAATSLTRQAINVADAVARPVVAGAVPGAAVGGVTGYVLSGGDVEAAAQAAGGGLVSGIGGAAASSLSPRRVGVTTPDGSLPRHAAAIIDHPISEGVLPAAKAVADQVGPLIVKASDKVGDGINRAGEISVKAADKVVDTIGEGIDKAGDIAKEQGAKALTGLANTLDKPRPVLSGAAKASATLGGVLLAGPLGSIGGAVAGQLLKAGVAKAADKIGHEVRSVSNKLSDSAAVKAYELDPAKGGLYRLPKQAVLDQLAVLDPAIDPVKARLDADARVKTANAEYDANSSAALNAINPEFVKAGGVDANLKDAIAFEQSVLLNRVLRTKPGIVETVIGFDPTKILKSKHDKVEANVQRNLDKAAGPLKQPPEAFTPLTTSTVNGVDGVLGFGKPLVDAVVTKVFNDKALKDEFIKAEFINPEGTKITEKGKTYLQKKFDEAHAIQFVDRVQPDGSVTRVFEPAKSKLTVLDALGKENAKMSATLAAEHKAELSSFDAKHSTDRTSLNESRNVLKADKTYADTDLSPEAHSYREAKRSKIAEIGTRIIELDAKLKSDKSTSWAARNKADKVLSDEFKSIQERFSKLGSDIRTFDRLGILDVVPEHVPFKDIASTTRHPQSKGEPIRNQKYRDEQKKQFDDLKAAGALHAAREALAVRSATGTL